MKTPIVKAVAAIFIFCLSANKISALTPIIAEDTTRKNLIAYNNKEERIVVLKEVNVEFPAILMGNEKESMDYIEKFFTSRKNYLIRTYQRSRNIFPKVENIFKQYNVPQEFKVLMALESGFNANAVSSAGAVGYWQFMDNVAKEYGLKIASKNKIKKNISGKETEKKQLAKSVSRDDRKNFTKSTHAAARYLQDRGRNLNNDWLLIAASYNCGVGNVWNAMERTGKANPTFWDIKKYLPAETRSYVMNFIVLNVLFNNYEKFSKNTLCFKTVTCIQSDIVQELPDLTALSL